MRIIVPLIGLSIATAAVALALAGAEPDRLLPAQEPTIDFARNIRPILAENCLKCHGTDPGSREADLRLDTRDGAFAEISEGIRPIVPGDPEASEAFLRMTEPFAEDRMPPPESGVTLTSREIDLIRRWIAEGAAWPEHWSFVPPREPMVPVIEQDNWARSDLDRFVATRLEADGMGPSPEADRRTLIRRLSLDLIGLPPSVEEVEAFVAETSPTAYEDVVDRLLASPRFGERWARVWLDLARYADTKGYEADRRRTMWPYRDWVIDAFNADMPYDEFTARQLAGDLLAGPTQADLVATGFHRNTMTNDEGGTDDEEFRSAAVIDRVNTTMTVWMGMTAACAQCHTHKYDPITHEEYYNLYAIFNNTADADRMDEEPNLTVLSDEARERIAGLRSREAGARARLDAMIDPASYVDPGPTAPEPGAGFVPIVGELLPYRLTPDESEPWPWIAERHDGGRVWRIDAGGAFKQRFFTGMEPSYTVVEGDTLVFAVRPDPEHKTTEIMLQVHTADGSWEHRGYWGANVIAFGADGTPARLRLGDLPEAGVWTTIEVPASTIGLMPGDRIDGIAFSQNAGRVDWSGAGVNSPEPVGRDWGVSRSAWIELEGERDFAGLDSAIAALARESPESAELTRYYLRHVHEPTRLELADPLDEIRGLGAEIAAIEQAGARMPIMRELSGDDRRVSHLFEKGSFLSPGKVVEPGVPDVFSGVSEAEPADRLELARWLTDPDNPLTARVAVNRFWESIFGRGLVETVEDFGTQGTLPTHPELLDWLALRFMEGGWSVKGMLRTMVTSATYRQSNAAGSEARTLDPRNDLLGRSPRYRLEGEMVRDSALAVGGLLSDRIGGPPVFPPQPDGVWKIVYNGDSWRESRGDDRYRRGLYTFWRRTSPYPTLMTFDAPSREICVARRIRTNTPLQALNTLNDPAFVEAAQALARRMMREADDPDDLSSIADRGVLLCLARHADGAELGELVALYESERERLGDDPDAARALAGSHPVESPTGATDADIAAWTSVALILLNLDEFLTRG